MEIRVVIVGAGSTGTELASRLATRHPVILVEKKPEASAGHGTRVEPERIAETVAGRRGVWSVVGDGSSRLLLQVLHDDEFHCALVAVAGDDEVNLEVGRLAREAGFDPVIAVQHDSQHGEAYRQQNITALDRSRLLADQVERSLRAHGAIVPSGIGLGRGELIEIRLLATSPILGRPLKNLAPYRWRVAAVFRGEDLIVPIGETTLAEDDRVLLVGDPAILPTVADYLRLGTPQFPQPYGPNVVTLEFAGPDDDLYAEADSLACACGALHLRRGVPGADASEVAQDDDHAEQPRQKGDTLRGSFPVPRLEDAAFASGVMRQRPGVVVVRTSRRPLMQRLLGTRGRDADVCDRLRVPVLFARGEPSFRRILLPISGGALDIPAAEMAIDLTRQLGASLTAVNVDLPRYISGLSEEVIHEEVVPIRRLCELYEVPLEYRHHEGNPVQHILAESEHHDLTVCARHFHRRDSFTHPDVALRVARQARCSVIVLTDRPGE